MEIISYEDFRDRLAEHRMIADICFYEAPEAVLTDGMVQEIIFYRDTGGLPLSPADMPCEVQCLFAEALPMQFVRFMSFRPQKHSVYVKAMRLAIQTRFRYFRYFPGCAFECYLKLIVNHHEKLWRKA